MIRYLIVMIAFVAFTADADAQLFRRSGTYTQCANGVCTTYSYGSPVRSVSRDPVVRYATPVVSNTRFTSSYGSAGGTNTSYGSAGSATVNASAVYPTVQQLEAKIAELEKTVQGLQSRVRSVEAEAFRRIESLEGFKSSQVKQCPCGPNCKCDPCLCELSNCMVKPASSRTYPLVAMQ